MTQWWQALTAYQQFLFSLAVAATGVMVVFIILMLIGAHGGDSFEAGAEVPDGVIDGTPDDVPDGLPDGGPDLTSPGSVDGFNDTPLSSFAGLRIFTVRGVLAFLSIGGWTAYALSDVLKPVWGLLIGAAAGALAAFLLAYALRQAMKLESEGNLDYRNAVGKKGTVYIKVPHNRTGIGHVNVTFQERLMEVDAVTDENEDLKTGTAVEITGLEKETTVIVKKVR